MKPVLHIQLILLLYNYLQFMADVNLHFILRSHLWSAMSEILLYSHMHTQLNVNMHSVIQVQFLRSIYCTLYFVSTRKHILPLALSLSVCVEWGGEHDVSAYGQWRSFHLAAQDGVAHNARSLSHFLQDLVQPLDAAYDRPLLHIRQLGNLRERLTNTKSLSQ